MFDDVDPTVNDGHAVFADVLIGFVGQSESGWWGWSVHGHSVAGAESQEQAERYLREWHEREERARARRIVMTV